MSSKSTAGVSLSSTGEADRKKLFPIFLETLRLDTILDFDIFIKTSKDKAPVLYRAKSLPFSEKNRTRLLDNAIINIYVSQEHQDIYQQYVEEHLSEIIDDATIAPLKKADVVYQSAKHLVKNILDEPRAGTTIPRSRMFVENTIDYLLSDHTAFYNLMKVASFNYYTYTHSVNVCVFGIALAKKLRLISREELIPFGTGTLLHDIGKRDIPQPILEKRDSLTDEEWEIVKRHPERGVEIVKSIGSLPEESLDIIKYHHEKLDGSGYPEGLSGSEIPLYPKITCVVDIFDALTTNRSYKNAINSFPALELMKTKMSDKIDREIFAELVLLLKP